MVIISQFASLENSDGLEIEDSDSREVIYLSRLETFFRLQNTFLEFFSFHC